MTTSAAELARRRELFEQWSGSGRRIFIGLLLVAAYTAVVYATGSHAGAGEPAFAEELHRADSAIVAAAKLAHVAKLRLDSAKRVVAVRRREAAPAIARSDSLRHIVTAIDETTLAVQRTPAAEPILAVVPPEVVQQRAADSTTIARLVALVAADSVAQLRADDRHQADSTQLLVANDKIEVLERRKIPRCGRKCGITIGVLGTLGTAVVIDHARDIVNWIARRAKPP